MLVVNLFCLKLRLEILVVNFLENVLETAVVALQNSVLCRQEHWQTLHERILEARLSKAANTLVRVVPESSVFK
jgi:hypothetical protein